MPIIKSAIKRVKQATKHRQRNVATKQDIKSAIKAFLAKPSAKGLSLTQSEIDTAVKKGLIKKNTAARRKSSLAKLAKNAGVKLETYKKAVKTVAKTTAKPKATAKPTAKKPIAKKATVKKPATKKPATKKAVAKKPATKKL